MGFLPPGLKPNQCHFCLFASVTWGKPNAAVTSRKVATMLVVSKTTVYGTLDVSLTSSAVAADQVLQNSSQFQNPETEHSATGFETHYFAAHNSGVGITLTIAEARGAVIIHELLHAVGRIPSDGENQVQSARNAELVRLFCFTYPNARANTHRAQRTLHCHQL